MIDCSSLAVEGGQLCRVIGVEGLVVVRVVAVRRVASWFSCGSKPRTRLIAWRHLPDLYCGPNYGRAARQMQTMAGVEVSKRSDNARPHGYAPSALS